jgi:hypothetical protein
MQDDIEHLDQENLRLAVGAAVYGLRTCPSELSKIFGEQHITTDALAYIVLGLYYAVDKLGDGELSLAFSRAVKRAASEHALVFSQ